MWTQSGNIQLDSDDNLLMNSGAVIGGTLNNQQFSGNVLIHVNMDLSGNQYLQMNTGSSITTTSTAANAVVVHAYPTTTGGGIQAGNITVGNGGGIQLYAAFDASQEPVQNPLVTDVANPTNTTRSGSITQMTGTLLNAGANGTITLEAASLGVATEGNIGLVGGIQTNAGTVNAVSTNQASATGGSVNVDNQGPATFTASTTAVSGTSAGGISLTTNTGLLTVAGVNVTSGGAITLAGMGGGVTIASGATLGNSATTGGITIYAGGNPATLNTTLTLYPNELFSVNATPGLVISATGTLAGSGATSNTYAVITQTGGVISPGTAAAPTGVLTTGNVDMSAGGTFFADLTSTGSNDLNVSGTLNTINLTGATLTGALRDRVQRGSRHGLHDHHCGEPDHRDIRRAAAGVRSGDRRRALHHQLPCQRRSKCDVDAPQPGPHHHQCQQHQFHGRRRQQFHGRRDCLPTTDLHRDRSPADGRHLHLRRRAQRHADADRRLPDCHHRQQRPQPQRHPELHLDRRSRYVRDLVLRQRALRIRRQHRRRWPPPWSPLTRPRCCRDRLG